MKKNNFFKILLSLFIISLSNGVISQNWNEIIKACASDREAGDYFGYSVAISGDYAIVGAPIEDENASGGDSLTNAGSVYIFHNNAGTWQQQQKLVASDREAEDLFGISVAISGDYAIVGAFYEDENALGVDSLGDAGSVYFFSSPTLGIKELSDKGIKIYPNPNKGKFNIECQHSALLSIKEINGKTILIKQIDSENTVIDISENASGIYILEIKTEGKIIIGKLVIQ